MSVSREEECFERHHKPLPLQCADRADMQESQSHMVMFPMNGQLVDASFGLRDLRAVVKAALGEPQDALAGQSIKPV